MAATGSLEEHRMSSSSLALPRGRSSRRSSGSSISDGSNQREAYTQALDQIHSTASQSNTLTTFNDFAPPPDFVRTDARGRSTSNTGAFGGIYKRLRASVSSSNVQPSPSPPRPRTGEGVRPLSRGHRPPPLTKQVRKLEDPGLRSTNSPRLIEPSLKSGVSVSFASADSAQRTLTSDATAELKSPVELFPSLSSPSIDVTRAEEPNEGRRERVLAKINTPKTPSFPSSARLSTTGDIYRDQSAERKNVDHQNIDEKHVAQVDGLVEPSSSDHPATISQVKTVIDEPVVKTDQQSTTSGLAKLDTTRGHSIGSIASPRLPKSASSNLTPTYPALSVPSASGSQLSTAHGSAANLRLIPLSSTKKDGLIAQMRRKILNRDFWMKDENAKVCFNCGDSFSTFRRKHHCRLCGQIYCSTCTHLVSGKPFGQASKLRVCKTCEVMMNGDDSSDFTEDEELAAAPPVKQIRFSTPPTAIEMSRDRGSSDVHLLHDAAHGKKARDSVKRRSFQQSLLDRQPTLVRPPSSRSLKSLNTRPRSISQKKQRPRNQHMRSLGLAYEEGVPFQQLFGQEDSAHEHSLPVFHTDSIIDPDLAPFMSDEGSSEEEAPSIAAALASDTHEQSVSSFQQSLFGALRKGRPQSGAKVSTDTPRSRRDSDTISISSSRAGKKRRPLGSRSISVASFSHLSSTPRVTRSDNHFASSDNLLDLENRSRFQAQVPDYYGGQLMSFETYINRKLGKPGLDLSSASVDYVKRLLRQFLEDVNIENTRQWEKALMPMLVRCADYVDPNIHRGDDIDIRHYVKIKKATGGLPSDSAYVSGVVFTKKLASKDMLRNIKNPRILLISFALVYARHQQHFMSLEPIIAQEREYLKKLVDRIRALAPSVLLVQKDVAGVALQYLQEAGISVAYNVKASVLQAVSRCTQTRIITSPEKLTMNLNSLGRCESFDVKTYVCEGYKRSLFFFSGCQRDLGCTIVLRGGDRKLLHQLKWIIEFMCYVTYNLKLETSLMRDHFISTPSISELRKLQGVSDLPGGAPAKRSMKDGYDTANTPVLANDADATKSLGSEKLHHVTKIDNGNVMDHSLTIHRRRESNGAFNGSYDYLVKNFRQRLLSVSPYVKLDEPYLVVRGRVQERKMSSLRRLLEQGSAPNTDEEKSAGHKFEVVKPDALYTTDTQPSPQAREIMRAIHVSEFEKASHAYGNLRRRWDTYMAGVHDPFSPLSHQKIVVLFSIVSTPTLDACEGPDLLGLEFYQEHEMDEGLEPDVPLGEYVERLCNQADSPCTAHRCDKQMIEHHRQYVHADGQVSVYLQKCQARLPGMENTILMWSACRKCDQETQVTPMSSNTWKYSFGKYLELSFWSLELQSRADSCPHDVHRDHKRFFGFRHLAVSFQYDRINVLEVTVPRATVTWAPDRDLLLKNEEYQRIEETLGRFMSSVRLRIKSINVESITDEKSDACRTEVEALCQRATEEHDELLRKLQERYMNSKYYEVTPLNEAMRHIQEKVAEWDTTFADFERDFFPSEKDIRRLATAQLRKMFLEREQISTSTETEEKTATRLQEEAKDEVQREKRRMHSPGPENVRSAPLASPDNAPMAITPMSDAADLNASIGPAPQSLLEHEKQLVQNLDLAVSTTAAEVTSFSLSHGLPQESPLNEARIDVETFRHRNVLVSKPSPLQPELVAKVDQLVEATAQEREGLEIAEDEPMPLPAIERLRSDSIAAPPLLRAQSQPVGVNKEVNLPFEAVDSPATPTIVSQLQIPAFRAFTGVPAVGLGKIVERPIMTLSRNATSIIPRLIPQPRNESKVSALAKHFEEMSREFEKERLRERRLRAQKNRQSRVYPMVASKPLVELFRDATEAVRERDASYDEPEESFGAPNEDSVNVAVNTSSASDLPRESKVEDDRRPSTPDDGPRDSIDLTSQMEPAEDAETQTNYLTSDMEDQVTDAEDMKDADSRIFSEDQDHRESSISEPPTESISELPKHEKSSLMKMLTRFWSERSASGWTPLEYPLIPTDHIFADSDVIVREDEPASLIAFSLASQDYVTKLARIRERTRIDDDTLENVDVDVDVERSMLGKTSTHMKYQFQAGSARMLCKIFYAESFDALRQKCGVADRFIESMSRCLKWDSKGGKSKSLFSKTLDERFIIKSLSTVETQAFLKFAPDYFDYMSKSLFHNLPSALAKMLGFYQVVIKNPATGTDLNYFLQVMENVFYEGPSNRMFDLKGSMRNRRIQTTGERDEVLLDENLLDYLSQSPIYVRAHSNSILASSITNDTLFCSKQNVMDYSLIVGLYEDRKELMVGIIDYIRTYTWDKKLESWIKDRGKHKPTVMSPKDYRNRFRASIPRYFPLAPSCWQVFGVQRTGERVVKLPWGGFEDSLEERGERGDERWEREGSLVRQRGSEAMSYGDGERE